MKKKWYLILIFTCSICFAQNPEPKIGLILSGGGAKGFSHIGILKEIDKAGIQLDYIGGTSMGAIIGGLYAYGYSANQIEDIVRNTDFLSLLRDQLPRSTSPFFSKEYGEKTKLTLPVNKGVVGLPKGVSRGQSVLNLLNELIDDKYQSTDFSKLSIPFFCIATDVETGAEIVLESGNLPLALRASGSFPTLLNPVEMQGKLLVDGGIANNFPVSILKAKGIDIIIGVDVEGRLFEKDKLNSAIAILNQIVSYQMYHKSDAEKEILDVYIHPDIYTYNVVDFDKKNEIIEKGIEKAAEFTQVFKEIAAKQKQRKKRKTKPYSSAKKQITAIKIKGANNYTRAYVLGKLKIKEGDSLSNAEITNRINLLSATKNYDKIDYQLERNTDASYTLNFTLKESNQNASLSLGVHYDLLYKSGLLVNYQQKNMILHNDLLSLGIILGDNIRYDFNYFVDNGFYFSYGLNSRYNHFRDNAKFNLSGLSQPGISNLNIGYTDFTNQVFAQTTFNRKIAIGLGVEHKFLKIETPTITNTNNEATFLDRSAYYSAFGYLKLDTYDQKYFVKKGFYTDLNFKWFLSSTDYNNNFKPFAQLYGKFGFASTIKDRLTVQVTNEAGFTFNNPTSRIFNFYLGGYNQNYINTFIALYGYDFSEFSDQSFLKSEVTLRYQLSEKNYAMFIANYARLADNVFKDIDIFQDILSGYALGYSYDSLIGPVELKYSWSPGTKEGFWLFNLGFWF